MLTESFLFYQLLAGQMWGSRKFVLRVVQKETFFCVTGCNIRALFNSVFPLLSQCRFLNHVPINA